MAPACINRLLRLFGRMQWGKELLVCGAGCLAGMMNAMAGGGTVVTFPALLWAGLSGLQANTTSTVALFAGLPLSVWSFRKHLGEYSVWLKKLAPIALIGGLLGGVLLVKSGARAFDWIVPWLLLLATLLFMSSSLINKWLRNRRGQTGEQQPLRVWSMVIFAAVAVYGGYFGAGIGIMMLATLGILGLRDMNQMNALKAILGMMMNLASVIYFILQGEVDWHWALWLMPGSVLGYVIGSYLAQRIPSSWVRAMGAMIGLTICILLFIKQWRE